MVRDRRPDVRDQRRNVSGGRQGRLVGVELVPDAIQLAEVPIDATSVPIKLPEVLDKLDLVRTEPLAVLHKRALDRDNLSESSDNRSSVQLFVLSVAMRVCSVAIHPRAGVMKTGDVVVRRGEGRLRPGVDRDKPSAGLMLAVVVRGPQLGTLDRGIQGFGDSACFRA